MMLEPVVLKKNL